LEQDIGVFDWGQNRASSGAIRVVLDGKGPKYLPTGPRGLNEGCLYGQYGSWSGSQTYSPVIIVFPAA
jgi:hypothetical protein